MLYDTLKSDLLKGEQ